MKKFLAGAAIITCLFAATACEGLEEPDNTPGAQRATTHAKPAAKGEKTKAAKPKPKPKNDVPQETNGQANARAKAADYLSYDAFSRQGLIDQLKYEGFNVKDATYGADAIGANWMQQAVKKAKDYLDYDSFSHAGLVQQLKYEGFTPQQAEFGTRKAGL